MVEHTADLEIEVFGEDRKSLFENAMRAMAECLGAEEREFRAREKIRVMSEDFSSLLVDFLNEVNYLNEVDRALYTSARFEELEEKKLVADIFGREVERFGREVKGVTFNELIVEKTEGGWRARVVFDI